MAGQQCPSCELWNPPEALACYCGRSFVDGTMNPPSMLRAPEEYRPPKSSRPASGFVGLALFLGGAAVTFLSPGTAVLGYPLGGYLTVVGLIWMIARAANFASRLR